MRDAARNLLFQIANALGGDKTKPRRLVGNVNWALSLDAIELAAHNRILPLLLDGIAQSSPEALESPVFERLRQKHKKRAETFEAQLRNVVTLLSELDAAGVHAVPYKGPVLSQMAFGSPLRREFRDIDLVVPAAQYEQAITILEGLGLEKVRTAPWESTVGGGAWKPPIYLDVHCRFMPPHLPELRRRDDLWDRLQPLAIGQHSLPTLSLIDTLLVTSLYMMKSWHNREPTLDYALALAVLLENAPEETETLLFALARDQGVEPAVRISCAAARRLADCGNGACEGPDWSRYRRSAAKLFDDFTVVRSKRPQGVFNFYAPRTIGIRHILARGTGDWLGRELSSIGPRLFHVDQDDRKWLQLPRALNGLYFAVRPLRLAQKQVRLLLHRES